MGRPLLRCAHGRCCRVALSIAPARRSAPQPHQNLSLLCKCTLVAAPIGKATEEHLRMALLAADQKRIQNDGVIHLYGNRYYSQEIGRHAGERVSVRFDPDNLHGDIHVYAQSGGYLGKAEMIVSISPGLIHSPPDLMRSFERPVILTVPSRSIRARSPVSNQPSRVAGSSCPK